MSMSITLQKDGLILTFLGRREVRETGFSAAVCQPPSPVFAPHSTSSEKTVTTPGAVIASMASVGAATIVYRD